MKKIIITLSLFCNSILAQDANVKHFSELLDNNETSNVLAECFGILDTAKIEANKQLANHYVSVVMYRQTKTEGGLQYAFKALKFKGPYTDRILNNIGCLYVQLKQYDSALVYLHKRLELVKGTGDEHINTLGNIAVVEVMKGDFKAAKKDLDTAFSITPKDKLDVLFLQYGDLYFYQSDFKQAIPFYMKSLATNPHDLNTKEAAYQCLAESYAHLSVADSTIKYYDLYNEVKELQAMNKNSKSVNELFIKYETKDKERQLEIQTAQVVRQQRYIGLGILSGLILLIILVIIVHLYNRVKVEKTIVVDQRAHLAHKNKEIEDSIVYARGIQEAILPTIAEENVFVLYKPKDIVSGDFYWTAEKHDRKYYAVADCTGHGVPGALMSMLCSQLLDEAIMHHTSPIEILDYVQNALDAKMKAMGRNDGMEIGLVSISKEYQTITFAGVGRSLFIVENNCLTICKEEAIFGIEEGMMLYMTTDGFTDQFGTNNKKFGSKRLKEEMTLCSVQTPENQLKMFNATLNYWQQDVEQTDDILLMGIKL